MQFEWDNDKNRINQSRHGVSFEIAMQIFNDPNIMSWIDQRFDYREERWISLGSVHGLTILVVAHQVKEGKNEETVRIISARRANRRQRDTYVQSDPEDGS